jgi:hypothetical protein
MKVNLRDDLSAVALHAPVFPKEMLRSTLNEPDKFLQGRINEIEKSASQQRLMKMFVPLFIVVMLSCGLCARVARLRAAAPKTALKR